MSSIIDVLWLLIKACKTRRSRCPLHLDWEQNLPSNPIWPPISFLSSSFPISRPRNLFLVFAYDFEQIFRRICPILVNLSGINSLEWSKRSDGQIGPQHWSLSQPIWSIDTELLNSLLRCADLNRLFNRRLVASWECAILYRMTLGQPREGNKVKKFFNFTYNCIDWSNCFANDLCPSL